MEEYKLQHYVFNTYKNRFVLIDPQTIDFLYSSFYETAKTKGFEIIACKILGDHVHCLIKHHSKHQVHYPIKMLKGISARDFFKTHRTNRYVYRKLWAKSYFSREISEDQIETVVAYIKNQINSSGEDKRFSQESLIRVSLHNLG